MMFDPMRGFDKAGRRAKRFLSPSEKYEIWLQLIRREATMAEAAAQWQVDRSTIMRIRAVAKEGALAALAESRPGVMRVASRGIASANAWCGGDCAGVGAGAGHQ
jgi:transposase